MTLKVISKKELMKKLYNAKKEINELKNMVDNRDEEILNLKAEINDYANKIGQAKLNFKQIIEILNK